MSDVETVSGTLTAFLSDRFSEDAAIAREMAEHGHLVVADNCQVMRDATMSMPKSIRPERVLAEVDAKRRIVDLLTYPSGGIRAPFGPEQEAVLRYLAEVYADHPDYRPEWRP